jgi:hypothetical protein
VNQRDQRRSRKAGAKPMTEETREATRKRKKLEIGARMQVSYELSYVLDAVTNAYIADKDANENLLDITMPNGKRLHDCTFGEISADAIQASAERGVAKHRHMSPQPFQFRRGSDGTTVTLNWRDLDGQFYWCVLPDGMNHADTYTTQEHHGPFASQDEAAQDAMAVLWKLKQDKPE